MTGLFAAIALLLSPPPTALLTLPHPVAAFAVSGPAVAYLDGNDCRVRVGPIHRLKVVKSGLDVLCSEDRLALARGRVIWGGYREVKCSGDFWIVATAGRVLENRSPHCQQGGDELTAITSDGRDLYYSYVGFDESRDCANVGNPCVFTPTGGSVVKVVNGRKSLLRGVPPAMLLAAGAGRIAIVRPAARFSWGGGRVPGTFPLPASGPLEVRNATTGRLVWSFALNGQATALATSGDTTAVVVFQSGKRRLEWYDARGELVRSVPLGSARVDGLALEKSVIAYRAGRLIRAIDAKSGKELARWTARGTPVGLELEGGHVSWAENRGGRGQILDASVPTP